jgi:uncharacterized protein (DUF3084 family)
VRVPVLLALKDQSPEAQSSKLKAQSSKLKAQSSKLKAQSSKLKAQSSKLKVRQSLKIETQAWLLSLPQTKPCR